LERIGKGIHIMRIIGINGSPRKKWNTDTLLQKALEGAASQGAETELIQLGDTDFRGCRSCFGCKLVGGRHECYMRDGLTPVLEKLRNADGLIFGSPIYFANITPDMRACLERLFFPYLMYSSEKPSSNPRPRAVAYIYTMNAGEEYMAPVKDELNSFQNFTKTVLGDEPQALYSYDTWQYPDYDKYEHSIFSVEDKKRQREQQFPLDCKAAYDLGVKLAKRAAELKK
jgi:multimeric flavodoxin WrbA